MASTALPHRSYVSCGLKAAIYTTAASARSAARESSERLGLPRQSFREYQCHACHWWHITKADSYKAWLNSPTKWRRWDVIEEIELGARAYACGRKESLGQSYRRRREIVQRGRAAQERRNYH